MTAAALTMGAGVAAGAFGAHALRDRLAPDLLAIYQTGVLYHLVHGLAALLAGVLAGHVSSNRRATAPGWLFLAGTVIFSGSLYLLALTGARWLGAVTPIGGTMWIVAWVLMARAAWTHR